MSITLNATFGLLPTPWPDIASTGLLGAIEGQKAQMRECLLAWVLPAGPGSFTYSRHSA